MPAHETIQSLETALTIVEELNETDGMGVTELARAVELPKSTVFTHLQTLLAQRCVVKTGDNYQLGLRFLHWGESVRTRRRLYTIARPRVDELAEATGELANLMLEEHGEGVYLYRALGANAVQLDTHAGMRVPLHTTALGKAMLAHMPPDRLDAIVERWGLPQYTEHTITTRAALDARLEQVRTTGIAVDDEERLRGVRCVAAPITDDGEHPLGAISVSAPTSRMPDALVDSEIAMEVMSVAKAAELDLKYG